METIIELNKNGEIDSTFYIDVGILFDGNFIKRRLEIKEEGLDVRTIGYDIKKIMNELKLKQLELLKKEDGLI